MKICLCTGGSEYLELAAVGGRWDHQRIRQIDGHRNVSIMQVFGVLLQQNPYSFGPSMRTLMLKMRTQVPRDWSVPIVGRH